MEDSILDSVKKYLGAENLTEFDQNIVMFTNAALDILIQNGVGPKTGFRITDAGTETWSDFLQTEHESLYEICKEFVYLKVKIVFDPPVGSVLDFYQKQIQEDLWRINVQADPADFFEVNKDE